MYEYNYVTLINTFYSVLKATLNTSASDFSWSLSSQEKCMIKPFHFLRTIEKFTFIIRRIKQYYATLGFSYFCYLLPPPPAPPTHKHTYTYYFLVSDLLRKTSASLFIFIYFSFMKKYHKSA